MTFLSNALIDAKKIIPAAARIKTAPNKKGKFRFEYANHIVLPSPPDAPVHSATTAPINDSGAVTFNAANKYGNDDGTWA